MKEERRKKLKEEAERRKEFIFYFLGFATVIIQLINYFFTFTVKIEKKLTNV